MSKRPTQPPTAFATDNEPYFGRASVFHFDRIIVASLAANRTVAELTRRHSPSPLQDAAC